MQCSLHALAMAHARMRTCGSTLCPPALAPVGQGLGRWGSRNPGCDAWDKRASKRQGKGGGAGGVGARWAAGRMLAERGQDMGAR